MQSDVTRIRSRERPFRVLVVEDEFLIALEIEQMVAGLGWVVIGPVPTVARALMAIDREEPDFAILDVNLGSERSTPVAEVLSARGVPFAVATGYNDRQLLEQAFRNVPRLGKPLEHHLLVSALARL
jgi:AmiR/NasT family two-component response regulator